MSNPKDFSFTKNIALDLFNNKLKKFSDVTTPKTLQTWEVRECGI